MSNNGVILERLSSKKLFILLSILVILQIVFFAIGGLKFPNATHTETVEGIMCRDKEAYSFWKENSSKKPLKSSKSHVTKNSNLYYLRDYLGKLNLKIYVKFNQGDIYSLILVRSNSNC